MLNTEFRVGRTSQKEAQLEILTSIVAVLKTLFELVQKSFEFISNKRRQTMATARERDGTELLRRFLRVFQSQKVPRPLIPRFAAAEDLLSIQQACSDAELSKVLCHDLLLRVSSRFAISTEWLYGVSDAPYSRDSSYKDPAGELARLISLLRASQHSKTPWDELLVIATADVPESSEALDGDLRLVILFRCQLDRIEGLDVERIHVFEDDLPWHHTPARIYAKQVFYVATLLGIHVRGVTRSNKDVDALISGEMLPNELLVSIGRSWHPSDYVLLRESSNIAKQRDEAAIVRQGVAAQTIELARRTREELGRQSYDDIL